MASERYNWYVPKLDHESFLDYKKRIIDSKSTTFCGAKWLNATIWLGSGKTTSCHHPLAHDINVNELKENPTAIHNTQHKKEMRRLMQIGQRPNECEYCWKIEDMDRGAVSDRVFKTFIYKDEDLAEIAKADYRSNTNLQTLEIAFDRNCQFACSYCNANFSTTWSQDIKKSGPYINLKSDGAGHFHTDGDESDLFAKDEKNPFIEAFWRWWPELSTSLKELRVTGGEPLMTPHLWKLFDYFSEHDSGNLVFAVNSNLGAKDDLIDRLIEKSKHIKKFKVFTSGEAFGKQGEYIRDGLDFNRWIFNIEKILANGRLDSMNIMMTINALSLFSMIEFLDVTLDIKKKYPVGHVMWSLNILRFPSFQSALTLPEDIKTKAREKLKNWCARNFESRHITDFEKESLLRLVDYLDSVKTPHRNTSDLNSLEMDFKSFYQQYDLRRGKDFSKTFPEDVVAWYQNIKN
jgi:organic radical activating enzyme